MQAHPAQETIWVRRRICSFDTEVLPEVVRPAALCAIRVSTNTFRTRFENVANTSRDVFVADYFAPVARFGAAAAPGGAAAPANPNPCTSKLAG